MYSSSAGLHLLYIEMGVILCLREITLESTICPKVRLVNVPSPTWSAAISERRSSPKSGTPQDLLEAPMPHILSKQCIGYKDVDHCLVETDITILTVLQPQWISVSMFSVEKKSKLFLTLSTFSVLSGKVADEEVTSLLQFLSLC